MALTEAKQALVTKKNENMVDYSINTMDIDGLVREAWKCSFARIETNPKAIVTRGRGPRAEVLTSRPGYYKQSEALDSKGTSEELILWQAN